VLYFLLSLFLCLLLSAAILACLIRALQINWAQQNKRPLGFLAPVFLTILFISIAFHFTVPRILDVVTIINKAYVIEDIEVDGDSLSRGTVRHEQRTYYYNQWRHNLEPGQSYRISYTPYSRFIVFFDDMTDLVEH
jgi:glucan phosphoethanolaminetransferase (alkaline phosphatase superfamily)